MESRPYSWVALDPDCDHPLDEKDKKKKENVIAISAAMAMDSAMTMLLSIKIWLRQILTNKSPMRQLLSEILVTSTLHQQTFKP